MKRDNLAISYTPLRRFSDTWLGKVSSSTGYSDSRLLCSSLPARSAELAVKKGWHDVQKCAPLQTIDPVQEHATSSLSSFQSRAPTTGEKKVRNEMVVRGFSTLSSPPRCRDSPSIFEKLFAHAGTQEDKQELVRSARERGPKYLIQENGPDDCPKVSSSRRRPTSTCGGALHADALDDAAEVFKSLYDDAERHHLKQEMLQRNEVERIRKDEMSMILFSGQPKGQRQQHLCERRSRHVQRLTRKEKVELFDRLATPVRRCKEKGDAAFSANDAATSLGVKEDVRFSTQQQSSVKWPLPSLRALKLADLRRHNEVACHMVV